MGSLFIIKVNISVKLTFLWNWKVILVLSGPGKRDLTPIWRYRDGYWLQVPSHSHWLGEVFLWFHNTNWGLWSVMTCIPCMTMSGSLLTLFPSHRTRIPCLVLCLQEAGVRVIFKGYVLLVPVEKSFLKKVDVLRVKESQGSKNFFLINHIVLPKHFSPDIFLSAWP